MILHRLDRYIIGAIFGLTGIVGLGLVTLYSFIGFVTEIDQGDKALGVWQIFGVTLLNMPAGLYVLMPLVAMLGTLLGVGSLAAQSELTAMRAAGYSNLRIGGAALTAGLLLGLFSVVLGESVAPAGEQAVERIKSHNRGGGAALHAKPVWLREGNNVFYIGRLESEREFSEAQIYRFSDALVLQSILAVTHARFADGAWTFTDVTETRFEGNRTEVLNSPELQWARGLQPDVLRLYVLQADTLSVAGLLRLVDYLDQNGLDASEQRTELWRKLVAPFTVMSMVLFAVPFVFGPTRGGGAGQRLLLGVLVGVSFHLLNEVSSNLGALYGWPAWAATSAPTVVLLAVGLVRLLRAR